LRFCIRPLNGTLLLLAIPRLVSLQLLGVIAIVGPLIGVRQRRETQHLVR
jgi:hypothetical protein